MRLFLSLLVAVMLSATTASAGMLTSAVWTQGVNTSGVIGNVNVPLTFSGTSTATSVSVTVAVSGGPIQLVNTVATGGALPLGVRVSISGSANIGGNQGTIGNIGPGVNVPAAIFLGGLPPIGAPFLNLPLTAGGGATSMFTAIGIPVTIIGYAWNTGVVQVTGLTNSPVLGNTGGAPGTRTFTGSFNLTAGGGGTVTLVSPTKVIVGGAAAPSTTSSFSMLQLTFVPEPGTLLLLGTGVAGLALLGARRRS